MKSFSTILLATVISLSTFANAHKEKNPLVGKTLKFCYPKEGYEYSSQYLNETHVEWKILKTPDNKPSKAGTEAYSFRELAEKVYLITWSEANGTDVNHIINLKECKIFAHATYKDTKNPDGRRIISDREGIVIDQTLVKRGYTGVL